MVSRFAVVVLALITFSLAIPNIVHANDSAASTAVGGLKLKREARISMEKERLTIGEKRVRVEYEFLNESDQDITTEVAFPIPEYRFAVDAGGDRDFKKFEVWVEGKRLPYQTAVVAICKNIDRTAILRRAGVDVASLGHFDWDRMVSRDIERLPARTQNEFIKLGLIDAEDKFPQWSVRKTYHWTQTFPSRQPLHVSHEYAPVIGFMPVSTGDLDAKTRKERMAKAIAAQKRNPKGADHWYIWTGKDIEQACVDPSLYNRIDSEARLKNKGADVAEQGTTYVEMLWVDYILTTANSWKTPIKDFELVVERPKTDKDRRWYVSFCWDGPIERPGADTIVAKIKDFVPKRELRIAFFGI